MSTAGSTTETKPTATDGWTELASRDNDGLTVALLWCKPTGRVKVTIADSRSDAEFELEVAGADALEAFHHPFAFAAAPRTSTTLQLQS
jgi:hypothetical protein